MAARSRRDDEQGKVGIGQHGPGRGTRPGRSTTTGQLHRTGRLDDGGQRLVRQRDRGGPRRGEDVHPVDLGKRGEQRIPTDPAAQSGELGPGGGRRLAPRPGAGRARLPTHRRPRGRRRARRPAPARPRRCWRPPLQLPPTATSQPRCTGDRTAAADRASSHDSFAGRRTATRSAPSSTAPRPLGRGAARVWTPRPRPPGGQGRGPLLPTGHRPRPGPAARPGARGGVPDRRWPVRPRRRRREQPRSSSRSSSSELTTSGRRREDGGRTRGEPTRRWQTSPEPAPNCG